MLLVLGAAILVFGRTLPPSDPAPEPASDPVSEPARRPPSEAGRAPRPDVPDRIAFSYRSAKQHLRRIHAAHRVTVYCGCRYSEAHTLDPEACGYTAEVHGPRRGRVEWEHAVPTSWIGQTRDAWRNGHEKCVTNDGQPYRGRRCAQRVDPLYKLAESDMYNLFPAIGAVNAIRGHHTLDEVPGEAREYGPCDFEDDGRRFEPRPEVRGELARAHLYMHWAYPTLRVLRPDTKARMEAWSRADPVDAWECQRAAAIAEVQKNVNPFVAEPCGAR